MIAALSSTTLTNAIDDKQTRFAVGSTSGINGLGSLTSPQSVLIVGGEVMYVTSVPVSGIVEVNRGVAGAGGTRARKHAASTTVYFGSRSVLDFQRTGEDGLVGLAGDPGSAGLPFYRLPLGVRAVDPNTGYEYLLCDYQAVFAIGDWVAIDAQGLASALSTSTKGRVGIITEVTVSDNWGWVLVAGQATAKHTSDVTTGCVLKAGAGTVDLSTSTGGNVVFNASVTTLGSSANDLGTAYINNPWVYGLTTDIVP